MPRAAVRPRSAVSVGIIGAVWVYALVSGFPYNVRYALAGLLAFLALVAVPAGGAQPGRLAGVSWGAVVVVSLWADAQWFTQPAYRKGDARGVAGWLVENKTRAPSWMVLPRYLGANVDWYLQAAPEVRSGRMPPTGERTTLFPPLPDTLILGRRHHIQNPDEIIEAFRSQAGEISTNRAFTGFEIYVRERGGASKGSLAPR